MGQNLGNIACHRQGYLSRILTFKIQGNQLEMNAEVTFNLRKSKMGWLWDGLGLLRCCYYEGSSGLNIVQSP